MNTPLALPVRGALDKSKEQRALPGGHSGSQRNQPFISAVIRDDHAFHKPQAPQHLNVLLSALIGTRVKQLLQLGRWQVPCIAPQVNKATPQQVQVGLQYGKKWQSEVIKAGNTSRIQQHAAFVHKGEKGNELSMLLGAMPAEFCTQRQPGGRWYTDMITNTTG